MRKIDFDNLDYSDAEAVAEAMVTLQQARAILTEAECASEPVGSDDGHYRDADKLKHDIDRMLEQLQNQSDSSDDGGNGGGGGQDENQDGGEGQDENQDQNDGGSDQDKKDAQSQKEEEQRVKEEKARQEKLKEDLRQQKEDLRDGSSSSSYDYAHPPMITSTSTAETPRDTEKEHYGNRKEKTDHSSRGRLSCTGFGRDFFPDNGRQPGTGG